jgi:hypothetical protein
MADELVEQLSGKPAGPKKQVRPEDRRPPKGPRSTRPRAVKPSPAGEQSPKPRSRRPRRVPKSAATQSEG